jgi:predicted nucleic acid-binding protein
MKRITMVGGSDGVMFDTNVHIAYTPPLTVHGSFLSSVVLQELVAGSDKQHQQFWTQVRKAAHQAGRVVCPDDDDWWEVGRMLNRMMTRRRHARQRIDKSWVNRIVRDALIARCAVKVRCTLVTDNTDFWIIKQFLPALRLQKAAQYFS